MPTAEAPVAPAAARARRPPAPPSPVDDDGRRLLDEWLAVQGHNADRHVTALRPFRPDEFGRGTAAPSGAHVPAVTRSVEGLRLRSEGKVGLLRAAVRDARRYQAPGLLDAVLRRKQAAMTSVLYVEGVWDFYFDLFSQRLSAFGVPLRAVDRICADCYEDLYVGLAAARPTPRLLPFSYADTGFSPLTYRRGVPLQRLRHHPNLFPLIVIPQHRLQAPWALSSVLHETSHNLQADLGLWDVMPGLIYRRLRRGRLPATVAAVWARWHKEMTADLFALLLGGPAAVLSLMDVVGRSRDVTTAFDPSAVHPTPYLRVLISVELLRRIGLADLADRVRRAWRRLYPGVGPRHVPREVLGTFRRAAALAVDAVAFTPMPQLAGRRLADVLPFGPAQLAMVQAAGRDLAAGRDPGTVPLRFLIGAARHAIDRRLAPPAAIADNFYRTLGRR